MGLAGSKRAFPFQNSGKSSQTSKASDSDQSRKIRLSVNCEDYSSFRTLAHEGYLPCRRNVRSS